MQKSDVILLLEAWTGRRYVIDIRDTEAGDKFLSHATTDKVHQVSELDRTTDAYLDALTVLPATPSSNTVTVLPGKFQLYEQIIEITDLLTSPAVPMIKPKDCDPSVVSPYRWSLLCVRKDLTTGSYKLVWAHGIPDGTYPEVPYNCVPLALVRVELGPVKIEHKDILTWRSVKPGYDPDSAYWLAPVKDLEELADKYGNGEDVPEGAQLLVLSEAKNYYWENGAWRAQTLMPFDNTVFIADLSAPTIRIDLPWSITDPVEISVFRDGQYVCVGNDFDYSVFTGATSYLLFNRVLLPGQRIVVIRNPFFAAAHTPGGGGGGGGGGAGAIPVNLIDIWVDGEIGNDTWSGKQDNPYKTLQRGFDACASYSNNAYRVHARRLKLADVVTDHNSQPVFGTIRNLRAYSLMIEIENDCEWDSSVYFAYSIYTTSFLQFIDHPIHYRFLLVESFAAFVNVEFDDNFDIYGGYTTIHTCETTTAMTMPVHLLASGTTEIKDSMFHHLQVGTHASVRADHTNFDHVYGMMGGLLQLLWCNITKSASFDNAALIMSNCTVDGTGYFNGGYVSLTSVQQVYPNTNPGNTFFVGAHGCNMEMNKVTIEFVNQNGIYMHHDCSLYIVNSKITQCGLNGIRLTHSSHIEMVNTEVSLCDVSGVMLELGSYGAFKDSFGAGSSRYGIECSGFSRGERDSTLIWGGLGDYWEIIPGSDTVITNRDDLVPGTLDEKIVPGVGLYKNIIVTGSTPLDNKFELGIDLGQLLTPDKDGNVLLNMTPMAHVFQRNTPIKDPGSGAAPDPDSYVDYTLKWFGDGYLSSVLRRISNPVIQTRQTALNLANAEYFLQQDSWRGTSFHDDGLTLLDYPILGYPFGPAPNGRPFFVLALADMPGAISAMNIATLQAFTLDCEIPVGTRIRIAFSINGGATWLTWSDADWEWQALPGESTLIALQGAVDYADTLSWHPDCWEELRVLGGISIVPGFMLSSTDPKLTPKLKSYAWTFVEDGYWLDITEMFERTFYSGRAVFKYKGGAVIDPPIRFTVYPLKNRG